MAARGSRQMQTLSVGAFLASPMSSGWRSGLGGYLKKMLVELAPGTVKKVSEFPVPFSWTVTW